MIRNIINTLITKFSSALFGFATIVLVSRALGTAGKGEQAIVVYNIYVLLLLFTLIGNSTLVYLASRRDVGKLLSVSLAWVVGIAILLLAFFVLFPQFAFPYILVSIPIAAVAAVGEINQFLLLGKERIREANLVKLLYPLVSFSAMGIMWGFDRLSSVWDCILAICLGYLAALIYGVWLLKGEYRSIKRLSFKEFSSVFKTLFTLGATKQVGSIAQSLNYRFSFYILGFYCGESLVGIYSNGASIGEAVMLFGSSLALVQYSTLSNSRNTLGAKRLTWQMSAVNALFSFLALAVLCFIPEKVYVFLFGAGFEGVRSVVRMLSVGLLLLGISSNFTQYFYSKGNFRISTAASLVGLAVTLVGSLVFVPLCGIRGAALTASASYCITFLIELFFFLRFSFPRGV